MLFRSVLQSATQGEGGDILVLEMGEPLRIVDVARQLIELSGLRPDTDIEIRIIGLRPGEKVPDQYRERLILYNFKQAEVIQIVDNCFGGVKDPQIVQFFEYEQNLICVLSDGCLYEFDRNLTLVKKLTLTPALTVFGYQNEIWLQDQNYIEKLKPSVHSGRIELPTSNYQQLQVLQDLFYFQQGQKIKVFRLKM